MHATFATTIVACVCLALTLFPHHRWFRKQRLQASVSRGQTYLPLTRWSSLLFYGSGHVLRPSFLFTTFIGTTRVMSMFIFTKIEIQASFALLTKRRFRSFIEQSSNISPYSLQWVSTKGNECQAFRTCHTNPRISMPIWRQRLLFSKWTEKFISCNKWIDKESILPRVLYLDRLDIFYEA